MFVTGVQTCALPDLEEKGTTENEMAGWHHRLDGREFELSLGSVWELWVSTIRSSTAQSPGKAPDLRGEREHAVQPGSPGESGLVSRGSQGLRSPLVERGLGIALQDMQEKKALISR